MNQLTLPIVVGKKYVRRDGKVVEAALSKHGADWARIDYSLADESMEHCVRLRDGHVWSGEKRPLDLVSDYIEPAKGHPHAEERCYGFKTGVTYVFTKPLTIPCGGLTAEQVDEHIARGFGYEMLPDPHAKVAAEYAKDMAVSNCAWESWECRGLITNSWVPLMGHPKWEPELTFRRKESL